VGSRLRIIAAVGVRMRPSGGEDVEGNAESLSELVRFDEVLPTDSSLAFRCRFAEYHIITHLGMHQEEKERRLKVLVHLLAPSEG
jgi:hypothetical protein